MYTNFDGDGYPDLLWIGKREMQKIRNWLYPEAALQRCSYKKVFWKYAANLHERTPMPKCDFNKVEKQLY